VFFGKRKEDKMATREGRGRREGEMGFFPSFNMNRLGPAL
jgi:hypothetical protein